MNKQVIYTAIFGGYDNITEPSFIPDGWDIVCFTDTDIKSDVWDVRKVLPLYEDPTRNARKYKILPHRFLSEYDYSIWIDGNILVRNNVNELVDEYLSDCNIAMMNHEKNVLDPRNCVYEEANTILHFGQVNGNYKDNPDLIGNQMGKYKLDSYPTNNGLAVTMEVLRKHNESDVVMTMEKWWEELKYNSKRDQLSFNYSAWKTDLNFVWMDGDSRDNKYFLHTGKHKGKNKIIDNDYEPINLEYFLKMELQPGGGGKEVVLNNKTLKTVGEVIEFWRDEQNVKDVQNHLNPNNWQYFNCMMGEFRKGVADHHKIGWDKLTKKYFESLEPMTDDEIEKFLSNNPVDFDNGYIRHSYHRACAMVGRLIHGKSYIPFYMKKEKIYDVPRDKDRIHRVLPLIRNVSILDTLDLPKSEYTITQSGILALMGIRTNDDIDIIISSKARKDLFNDTQQFLRFNNGVEIFEPNKSKFLKFGALDDDDLINNYSFQVDGYNFLEPRFYFSRKRKDRDKDITDWEGIRKFFEIESYKGYPFNRLTLEQWGYEFI
jgi:hypothetical protein